jgi:hypothetical protein
MNDDNSETIAGLALAALQLRREFANKMKKNIYISAVFSIFDF